MVVPRDLKRLLLVVTALLAANSACGARSGRLSFNDMALEEADVRPDAGTFPDAAPRDGLPWEAGASTYKTKITLTADDAFQVWANGKSVGQEQNWKKPHVFQFDLKSGKNVVAVRAWDDAGVISGVIIALQVNGNSYNTGTGAWVYKNGTPSGAWRGVNYNDASWTPPVKIPSSVYDGYWGWCSKTYHDLGAEWVWNGNPTGLGAIALRSKINLP